VAGEVGGEDAVIIPDGAGFEGVEDDDDDDDDGDGGGDDGDSSDADADGDDNAIISSSIVASKPG
jgi:hypothetical protein